MVKRICMGLVLACYTLGCQAQMYYGDEALKMMARYVCHDMTIHVKSKSTQDSIPNMSFELITLLNPIEMLYDTITINTVAPGKYATLIGYVKRTKNDLFFKTIKRAEYTLNLYIGDKKYIKKFFSPKKSPTSEITIDVD